MNTKFKKLFRLNIGLMVGTLILALLMFSLVEFAIRNMPSFVLIFSSAAFIFSILFVLNVIIFICVAIIHYIVIIKDKENRENIKSNEGK